MSFKQNLSVASALLSRKNILFTGAAAFALSATVAGLASMSLDATASSEKAAVVKVANAAATGEGVKSKPIDESTKAPMLAKVGELTTLKFKVGSFEVGAEEKAALTKWATQDETLSAAKVHVKGFSGNSTVKYDERRALAFSRAWSVKEVLVTEGKLPAKKVRMFFFSNDHMGQPRAEVLRFETAEMAQADAKKSLKK